MFNFRVYGEPVSKGSGFFCLNGRPIPQNNQKCKKWERAIRAAWLAEYGNPETLDEPVSVHLTFYLKRPQTPRWSVPAVKPDIDKLTRAVLDGLQETKKDAGLIKDDSRVWHLEVEKEYADSEDEMGVRVVVGAA